MMMISYRLKTLEFPENRSSLSARFFIIARVKHSANASQFFPPHVLFSFYASSCPSGSF